MTKNRLYSKDGERIRQSEIHKNVIGQLKSGEIQEDPHNSVCAAPRSKHEDTSHLQGKLGGSHGKGLAILLLG